MKDQDNKQQIQDIPSWEDIRQDFEKHLGEQGVDTQVELPSHNSLSKLLDRFVQYLVSSIALEVKEVLEAGLGAKGRITMADYLKLQNLVSRSKKGKL